MGLSTSHAAQSEIAVPGFGRSLSLAIGQWAEVWVCGATSCKEQITEDRRRKMAWLDKGSRLRILM
jgi:hypothetical protein